MYSVGHCPSNKCTINTVSHIEAETAGFITRVVPTPTEQEFLQAVGKCRRSGGVTHVDRLQPDDCKEEMCAHIAVHDKK